MPCSPCNAWVWLTPSIVSCAFKSVPLNHHCTVKMPVPPGRTEIHWAVRLDSLPESTHFPSYSCAFIATANLASEERRLRSAQFSMRLCIYQFGWLPGMHGYGYYYPLWFSVFSLFLITVHLHKNTASHLTILLHSNILNISFLHCLDTNVTWYTLSFSN